MVKALNSCAESETCPYTDPPAPTPPAAPGPDKTAPKLLLGGATRQRFLRGRAIYVYAKCDEVCTITASGRIAALQVARALRTASTKLTLKPSPAVLAAQEKLYKQTDDVKASLLSIWQNRAKAALTEKGAKPQEISAKINEAAQSILISFHPYPDVRPVETRPPSIPSPRGLPHVQPSHSPPGIHTD